jgi:hypothetical protein
METLYFVLYLLAFVFFVGAAAAAYRRPERPFTWVLVPLGLAAWSLVLVIAAARALGN